MENGWWAAGQAWLCMKANDHFAAWASGKDGARWRAGGRKGSPYAKGYTQPKWMDDARDALGRNDEHRFKAIKLDNL